MPKLGSYHGVAKRGTGNLGGDCAPTLQAELSPRLHDLGENPPSTIGQWAFATHEALFTANLTPLGSLNAGALGSSGM